MTIMPERLSRRNFLGVLSTSAAALVADGVHAIPKEPEFGYSEKVIFGIPVYGAEAPIKPISVFGNLIDRLEEESFTELRQNEQQAQEFRGPKRDLLPENFRYWEFVVPKSVYDKFTNGDKSISFPEWANLQVRKTNKVLSYAKPEIPFRIQLKRIFVLDDSLYPRESPYWLVDRAHDNFSRWAKDVDSRWALSPDDYYDFLYGEDKVIGELNPGVSGIRVVVGTYAEVLERKDGKLEVADWGLIHELIHHLDVGDLYWPPPNLPKSQFGHLPARYRNFNFFTNDIMSSPTNRDISPLTAYAINLRASEGHRGVQPDGVRLENHYLMFPDEATITLEAESQEERELKNSEDDSNSLIDKVSVVIGKDEIFQANADNVSLNSIRVNQEINERGWECAYLAIEGRLNGRSYCLPFPRFVFNLSAWVQDKKPNYRVILAGEDDELKWAQSLSVQVIHEDYFESLKHKPGVIAWAKIPKVESYLVWELVA